MGTAKPCYWTVDRIMHLIIGVAVSVILILLARYLSKVLLPFFAACFIAYLLQPMVDFNSRLVGCKGRVLPSVMTLIDITVLIGLALHLVMPSVLHELGEFGRILREASSGQIAVPPFYRNIVEIINRYFNPENLHNILSGERLMTIINGGSSIIEESLGILIDVLSWLLTIIYVLFILIDYPQISRGIKMIVPRKYRPRMMPVLSDVLLSMNHYFRGQGIVALCAMVLYSIGFSIVKLPLAIPMGLLVGVLYMIPYFQYVTLVPVAAICFVYSLGGSDEFISMLGKCGLVYVISQCICDYVITPHVMKREIGLNPAVILLSFSVWGCLLGIIGMIIALPVTAMIITFYDRYISEPETAEDESRAEDS